MAEEAVDPYAGVGTSAGPRQPAEDPYAGVAQATTVRPPVDPAEAAAVTGRGVVAGGVKTGAIIGGMVMGDNQEVSII